MLRSGRGLFIVIVGPDGAGKTTLARALTEQYAGPTGYFHFIPPVRGPLPATPPPESAPPPTKTPPRDAAVLGWIRLARSVVRSWLGYLGSVRPALARGTLVVADRWLYGYVAQPRALRFNGPRRLAEYAIALLPRPDLVVSLIADVDVIHGRKQELTRDEIAAELTSWGSLTGVPLARVDATGSPANIAAAVLAQARPQPIYKHFPPGQRRLLVPLASREAALAGLALYPACRPRAVLAQRAATLAVRAFGPGVLPGRGAAYDPPCGTAVWDELLALVRDATGGFDSVAIYQRFQTARPGIAVLALHRGVPRAFVKLRRDGVAVQTEAAAQRAVAAYRPRAFVAPQTLGCGTIGEWHYLASTPIPGAPHAVPSAPPLARVLDEVAAALSSLPREGAPDELSPAHGDFAPWNLRQLKDGRLVLVDWEDAGWRPPGTDEVWYRACAAAMLREPADFDAPLGAVRYWLARVRADTTADAGERLGHALERVLVTLEQRALARDGARVVSVLA